VLGRGLAKTSVENLFPLTPGPFFGGGGVGARSWIEWVDAALADRRRLVEPFRNRFWSSGGTPFVSEGTMIVRRTIVLRGLGFSSGCGGNWWACVCGCGVSCFGCWGRGLADPSSTLRIEFECFLMDSFLITGPATFDETLCRPSKLDLPSENDGLDEGGPSSCNMSIGLLFLLGISDVLAIALDQVEDFETLDGDRATKLFNAAESSFS